jgi:hypothetical protein
MTIYLKKPYGTIEQFSDDRTHALNVDKELLGESFGTVYREHELPDEDKLSLGLITQKEIDDKNRAQRIFAIKDELSLVDSQTMRPLRAKIAGTSTAYDDNKLIELETYADTLRKELANLS